MFVDHCAKIFKKAFLPAFRDCRWMTFHGHCIYRYSTKVAPCVSCRHLHSMIRHSHNSAAQISCQKLDHRSLVRVCGADVLGFLQGLVTNDVQLLETDGSAMYAMMLNVQVSTTAVWCSAVSHLSLIT